MSEKTVIEKWDDHKCKYIVTFHKLVRGTGTHVATIPLRIFKYEDGDYVLDYDNHSMPHRSVEIKNIKTRKSCK